MFEQFKKFESIIGDLLEIATPAEIEKINAMNATMEYCMDPMVSKPDLMEVAEAGMYDILIKLEKRLTSRST